jgi:hypothetical protein
MTQLSGMSWDANDLDVGSTPLWFQIADRLPAACGNMEPEFRLALDTFRPSAVAMLTCLGVAFSELRAGEWPFGGRAASGPYAFVRADRALCAFRRATCTRPHPKWAQFGGMFDHLRRDEAVRLTRRVTAPHSRCGSDPQSVAYGTRSSMSLFSSSRPSRSCNKLVGDEQRRCIVAGNVIRLQACSCLTRAKNAATASSEPLSQRRRHPREFSSERRGLVWKRH